MQHVVINQGPNRIYFVKKLGEILFRLSFHVNNILNHDIKSHKLEIYITCTPSLPLNFYQATVPRAL